uniref:Uncharacterized protein n=1 Tax=Chrysotila carterae TaxID=13221 RepID=A0A6S9RMA6_CHRCT
MGFLDKMAKMAEQGAMKVLEDLEKSLDNTVDVATGNAPAAKRLLDDGYCRLRLNNPMASMAFENIDKEVHTMISRAEFAEYIKECGYEKNVQNTDRLFNYIWEKTNGETQKSSGKRVSKDHLDLSTFIQGYKAFNDTTRNVKEPSVGKKLKNLWANEKNELLNIGKDGALLFTGAFAEWFADYNKVTADDLLSCAEVYNTMLGTKVMFSFGARDGGLDLSKSLQELVGTQADLGWDMSTSYIDCVNNKKHRLTEVKTITNADGSTFDKVLNPHWAEFYYMGATLASVCVICLDQAWMDSEWCKGEAQMFIDLINNMYKGRARADDSLMGKINVDTFAGAEFRFIIVYDQKRFKTRGEVRSWCLSNLGLEGMDLVPATFAKGDSCIPKVEEENFIRYLRRAIEYRNTVDADLASAYRKQKGIVWDESAVDKFLLSQACYKFERSWQKRAADLQLKSRGGAPAKPPAPSSAAASSSTAAASSSAAAAPPQAPAASSAAATVKSSASAQGSSSKKQSSTCIIS